MWRDGLIAQKGVSSDTNEDKLIDGIRVMGGIRGEEETMDKRKRG